MLQRFSVLPICVLTAACIAACSDDESAAAATSADAKNDDVGALADAHGHEFDAADAASFDSGPKDAAVPGCESFCKDLGPICMGIVPQPYASYSDCLTACAQYAVGNPGDTSGDTLACRVYFMKAAKTDAVVHCQRTAADSTTCR